MSINFTTLATSALGFTVALAWNDAVSKTIKSFFPPTSEQAAARATLIYALVVTVLVILVVAVINHARKIVHEYNSRVDSLDGRERPARVAGPRPGKGGAPPRGGGPEAPALGPVIRLWEPPQ